MTGGAGFAVVPAVLSPQEVDGLLVELQGAGLARSRAGARGRGPHARRVVGRRALRLDGGLELALR